MIAELSTLAISPAGLALVSISAVSTLIVTVVFVAIADRFFTPKPKRYTAPAPTNVWLLRVPDQQSQGPIPKMKDASK